MKKKSLALLLSVVLVLGVVAGSSLAWLTAKDDAVVNVFSHSDIDIDLDESTTDYKMIPGWTIAKDPNVTVVANSEECYVFVKVDKSATYDSYLKEYVVDEAWTQLVDDKGTVDTADDVRVDGVFYQHVAKQSTDWNDYVLAGKDGFANGYVTVKDSVTKEMMGAIDGYTATNDKGDDATELANRPTLSFTAYASQYWKNNTEYFGAYEAWLNIFDANANGTPDSEEVNP